jgi:hypothetical protein
VVVGAVVRALEAVNQRPAKPDRCATEAQHVIKLQRATGTPWEELAAEIELVARWARDSHDPIASNDIRGVRENGEAWGADRSREVDTICRHGKWLARLRHARDWEAGTGPPAPRARGGEHSSLRRPEPTPTELAEQDPHLWDPL